MWKTPAIYLYDVWPSFSSGRDRESHPNVSLLSRSLCSDKDVARSSWWTCFCVLSGNWETVPHSMVLMGFCWELLSPAHISQSLNSIFYRYPSCHYRKTGRPTNLILQEIHPQPFGDVKVQPFASIPCFIGSACGSPRIVQQQNL